MEELSPEQKANLETWAGQRDLLLSEISNLQTVKDKLLIENREKAASSKEIEDRANQIIGRIEELQKKEAELPTLISKEVASLESRKTVLESEITTLSKMAVILSEHKASLEKDVSSAISNFDILKSEALTLDKIVDHVTVVSDENSKKINVLVNDLAKSLEEIIEVNKKNVLETNIVIDKVPRMIMEAQKHGLIKNKI
jgi:chromosome segregation ATPase